MAFDFYQAFYARDEWYRRLMVLCAFGHIAWETLGAFRCIVRVEARTARAKWKAWRFFLGFARDLFVASLPVYRRDYHPRNHPICNEGQNRLARAWRGYVADGNDALRLDDAAIASMLDASAG